MRVVLCFFEAAVLINWLYRKVHWHIFASVRVIDSFGPQELNSNYPFFHLQHFVAGKVEVSLTVLRLMLVEPLCSADTE